MKELTFMGNPMEKGKSSEDLIGLTESGCKILSSVGSIIDSIKTHETEMTRISTAAEIASRKLNKDMHEYELRYAYCMEFARMSFQSDNVSGEQLVKIFQEGVKCLKP